jgi:hypothetical protein
MNRRHMLAGAAALASVALTAGPVLAHDPKPQHGGRVTEAGEYHVELVTKADVVEVYLTDHDSKAVSATGHKGLAILNIDGKSQRIVLEPAGDSRLTGKATGSIQGRPKGVVQITPPSGKTAQARFN